MLRFFLGFLIFITCCGDKHTEKTNPKEGGCNEQDIKKYIYDPNPKFIAKVRECSRKTWANQKKNTACLLKAMPSLSKPCAKCFAQMAECSFDNCKLACAFSDKSKKCVDCANNTCQPKLVACTGVEAKNLP